MLLYHVKTLITLHPVYFMCATESVKNINEEHLIERFVVVVVVYRLFVDEGNVMPDS